MMDSMIVEKKKVVYATRIPPRPMTQFDFETIHTSHHSIKHLCLLSGALADRLRDGWYFNNPIKLGPQMSSCNSYLPSVL